jgi:hypothetical protein
MPGPPGYLDECLDLGLAPRLRRRGYAVTTAREAGQLGLEDDAQLAYASAHDLVIVSHNARHFWRWHQEFLHQGRPHGGIVLVPDTGPLSRLELRIAMLFDWAGTAERRSRLFRWGDLQTRLTQGFRLPGYSEDDHRHALGQQ